MVPNCEHLLKLPFAENDHALRLPEGEISQLYRILAGFADLPEIAAKTPPYRSGAATGRGDGLRAAGTPPAWLDHSMRIATYTSTASNGGLANPCWARCKRPRRTSSARRVLKAPDDKFPGRHDPALALRHGQKSGNGVAILARGAEPVETRRGLPIPATRTAATSKRR